MLWEWYGEKRGKNFEGTESYCGRKRRRAESIIQTTERKRWVRNRDTKALVSESWLGSPLWFNMFPVSVIIIALCVPLCERGRRSSDVTRGMAACYCHYRGNSNIPFNTHRYTWFHTLVLCCNTQTHLFLCSFFGILLSDVGVFFILIFFFCFSSFGLAWNLSIKQGKPNSQPEKVAHGLVPAHGPLSCFNYAFSTELRKRKGWLQISESWPISVIC